MHSGIQKVRINTRGIEQDPKAFMRQVGTDHIERKFLDIPYGGQSRAQELDLYLPGEGAGHGDIHFSMPENIERVFGFLDEVFGL